MNPKTTSIIQARYDQDRLDRYLETIEARRRTIRRFKTIVNLCLFALAFLVIWEAFFP